MPDQPVLRPWHQLPLSSALPGNQARSGRGERPSSAALQPAAAVMLLSVLDHPFNGSVIYCIPPSTIFLQLFFEMLFSQASQEPGGPSIHPASGRWRGQAPDRHTSGGPATHGPCVLPQCAHPGGSSRLHFLEEIGGHIRHGYIIWHVFLSSKHLNQFDQPGRGLDIEDHDIHALHFL